MIEKNWRKAKATYFYYSKKIDDLLHALLPESFFVKIKKIYLAFIDVGFNWIVIIVIALYLTYLAWKAVDYFLEDHDLAEDYKYTLFYPEWTIFFVYLLLKYTETLYYVRIIEGYMYAFYYWWYCLAWASNIYTVMLFLFYFYLGWYVVTDWMDEEDYIHPDITASFKIIWWFLLIPYTILCSFHLFVFLYKNFWYLTSYLDYYNTVFTLFCVWLVLHLFGAYMWYFKDYRKFEIIFWSVNYVFWFPIGVIWLFYLNYKFYIVQYILCYFIYFEPFYPLIYEATMIWEKIFEERIPYYVYSFAEEKEEIEKALLHDLNEYKKDFVSILHMQLKDYTDELASKRNWHRDTHPVLKKLIKKIDSLQEVIQQQDMYVADMERYINEILENKKPVHARKIILTEAKIRREWGKCFKLIKKGTVVRSLPEPNPFRLTLW